MDLSRNWRLRRQRLNLIGNRCEACDHSYFPPVEVCAECGSRSLAPVAFSGRGHVYSYATVYQAPAGFEDQAPYTVALVRLEEGPLVTAQLTDMDPGDVAIGDKVEMVTRKLREYGEAGLIVYGYKFRKPIRG